MGVGPSNLMKPGGMMGNIVDYAQTMMETFDQRPFSRVDSLVLSQLTYLALPSYVPHLDLPGYTSPLPAPVPSPSPAPSPTWWDRWKGSLLSFFQSGLESEGKEEGPKGSKKPEESEPELKPRDLDNFLPLAELYRAEEFASMFKGDPLTSEHRPLLEAVCASPRFRQLRVGNYTQNENTLDGEEQQFAAVTYLLPDGREYLAFRGTEPSLVGWKEDFAMTYSPVIPSQTEAVAYTQAVAAQSARPLLVGGHSKGGNMAVYAAVMAEEAVQDRIQAVYSHDGPGFHQEFYDLPGWKRIGPKEDKTCPQYTVIGQLMRPESRFDLVKSNTTGVSQHYCLNWLVEKGDFVPAGQIDPNAERFDNSLRNWLQARPYDQRKTIVTTVYQALKAGGYDNIQELKDNFSSAWPKISAVIGQLEPGDKSIVLAAVKDIIAMLIPSMIGNFFSPILPPTLPGLRPNQQTQQNPQPSPKQKV